jgi:hypothetical protein
MLLDISLCSKMILYTTHSIPLTSTTTVYIFFFNTFRSMLLLLFVS